jgi:hypothetical protein
MNREGMQRAGPAVVHARRQICCCCCCVLLLPLLQAQQFRVQALLLLRLHLLLAGWLWIALSV